MSSINLSRVFRVQEVLLPRSQEEISIGGGYPGSHGCALNLKVMEGVKGEVLVSKDEVHEGYEELSRSAGGGRAFR